MNNRIIKNQLAKPFKMNINKYYTLSIGLILLVFSDIYAQQDPQYTQYMYNTQVINPAYAGSKDALSFGLLTRKQWVGFDGAPNTSTFTINSPFWIKEKMGIGLSKLYMIKLDQLLKGIILLIMPILFTTITNLK